jgi:hypothetical protein
MSRLPWIAFCMVTGLAPSVSTIVARTTPYCARSHQPGTFVGRLQALAVAADVSVATLDRNWPLWPAMLLAR